MSNVNGRAAQPKVISPPEIWDPFELHRFVILGEVQKGKMTPVQAEAWAQEKGLQPFERHPDPARFDPMVEIDWSLPMALAWAIWREPDAARRVWPLYSKHVWQWIPWLDPGRMHEFRTSADAKGGIVVEVDEMGHHLFHRDEWTIGQIVFQANTSLGGGVLERPGYLTSHFALAELWRALRVGTIVATGRAGEWNGRSSENLGERQPIARTDWADLSGLVEPSQPADALLIEPERALKFFNVLVLREDVVRAFPAIDSSAVDPENTLTGEQIVSAVISAANQSAAETALIGKIGPEGKITRRKAREFYQTHTTKKPTGPKAKLK